MSMKSTIVNNNAGAVSSKICDQGIHVAFGVGTTRVSGSGVEIGVDDVSGHGDVT